MSELRSRFLFLFFVFIYFGIFLQMFLVALRSSEMRRDNGDSQQQIFVGSNGDFVRLFAF